MHVFISAGEPSGDLHGANLARALRVIRPEVTLTGFGGGRMREAGCDLDYPLAEHAIMGVTAVLRVLPEMVGLLNRTVAGWRRRRPDVVVCIDYPGFHWHLARRAKAIGIPVVSFVPPQIWSWASFRVRKMRACFDTVCCSLPFEEEWFRQRGVPARYVGHPYFDELGRQQLDESFIAAHRHQGGPIIGVLPGSRQYEIDRNLDLLVGIMRQIHTARPDGRFLLACYKPRHRDQVVRRLLGEQVPAEVHVGRTPEIIALADVCAAVSGSVSLELLHRRVPTVVVYRVTPMWRWVGKLLLNVPYISLVNLLAGREVFPEFLTSNSEPTGPAAPLVRWLADPAAAQAVRGQLDELYQAVGQPGACARTAAAIIEMVEARPRTSAVA